MNFIQGLRFSIGFRFRRSEEQKTCHFQAFGTKVLGVKNLSAWHSMVHGAMRCLALCFLNVWRFASWCLVLLALYFSMLSGLAFLALYFSMIGAWLSSNALLLSAWCSWYSASLCLVLLVLFFSLLSALLSWSLALLGATNCFYIFLFGSTWFWMQRT